MISAATPAISLWQRETSQQRADRLLNEWQRRKHLPPELRLNDNFDSYGATLDAVRESMGRING